MKIVPEPPRPVAEPPARPAGEPARPFTDFLADPDLRAARFAELGMFGRSRAAAAPERQARRAAVPGDPAPPGAEPPGALSPGTVPANIGETTAAPPLPIADDAAACALPGPVRPKADPGAACALPGEADGRPRDADARVGPEPPARTAQPRSRPRQAAPRPEVSLIVRETEGGVEIVAGTSPIDPEMRVRLRRLVEAMLARNGLALAQFQLNGAPVAPDLTGKSGGMHGPGTR